MLNRTALRRLPVLRSRALSASAAAPNTDPYTAAAAHCLSLVQERDKEHYFAGIFVPPAARKAYFAIRALNVELASIPATTGGNVSTAQLRVGWWRDAIAGMHEHGSVEVFPQHPVVTALTAAVREHGLSKAPMERLLEAREYDLTQAAADGFGSMAQVELYAAYTAGAQMQLTLESLAARGGGKAGQGAGGLPDEASEAARLAGVGAGIATLLRGTAHHVRVGQLYLPRCAMDAAGANAHDVAVAAAGGHSCGNHPEHAHGGGADDGGAGESGAKVKAVVVEMAGVARERLAEARALQDQIPAELRPALLPATLAEHWLGRLEEAGHDVFDAERLGGRTPVSLQVQMWWRSTRGVFL
jgi:phytoene synthase